MQKKIDYNHYRFSPKEVCVGYGAGFAIGFAVSYIFFHAWIFSLIVGIAGGFVTLRQYRAKKIDARRRELLLQFKNLLESLASSFSAGQIAYTAFWEAYKDLKGMYGEQGYLVQELGTMLEANENGIPLAGQLAEFASRCGLEDIQSFADVYVSCELHGVDMRNVVCETRQIINDKIDIEQQIREVLHSGKSELNMLVVMPVIMQVILGSISWLSASDNTPMNIIIKTISILLFAIAYMWGSRITRISI